MTENHVAPHDYLATRRKWWQVWKREHCLCCYLPEKAHPALAWRRARPIGDTRTAGEVMREERING